MKKYVLVILVALLSSSCSGQKKEKEELTEGKENIAKKPKGSWKVDKEFDEYGNLIKYDSIYSWSSNDDLKNLSSIDRDSLMHSFKSRFFSNNLGFKNHGFDDIFSQDSLFSKRFFNDDFFESEFGNDFMNVDKMTQQMLEKQKRFLEKYQSEFNELEESE